jgi:hypothetical protein
MIPERAGGLGTGLDQTFGFREFFFFTGLHFRDAAYQKEAMVYSNGREGGRSFFLLSKRNMEWMGSGIHRGRGYGVIDSVPRISCGRYLVVMMSFLSPSPAPLRHVLGYMYLSYCAQGENKGGYISGNYWERRSM